MYEKNSAIFLTQKGETEFFEVITSVLQGDTLAPFLFVTVLDFALRKSINTDGIMLIRRQKCHHPPIHLADLDFADDIAQLEETICQAERVLHKVEAETLSILLINVQKTKYVRKKLYSGTKFQDNEWIRAGNGRRFQIPWILLTNSN